MKTIVLSILLLSAASCSRDPHEFELTKLPSGREVRITSVLRMNFPQAGDALVLHYETDIPIEDKVALRKEVDDVWEYLKDDVERENLKAGIIRATKVEGLFFKSGKGHGFVFVKQGDGTWQCTEDAKK